MSYNKIKTDAMVKMARWIGRRSMPTLQRLGRLLGWFFYWLPNRRKRVAAINLAICFPNLSQQQIKKLLKLNLISTGQGVLEMMAALWADEASVNAHFEVVGMEHLEAVLNQQQGCLLLSCHTTSIEWGIRGLNHHLRSRSLPVGHMLARQHNNKILEAHLEQARLSFVDKLIDKKNLRSLFQSIKSGHPVYYAPDQNFSYQVKFADFFGRSAATTSGTHKLASKGIQILPWFCFRVGPGQWRVEIQPPMMNLSEMNELQTATAINQLFEAQINQHPEQYLWVHRRFKNQPAGMDNPYQ